ncbi:PREDICTED: glutathione S-transferase T3 [Prunus dulcis]|uniref:PREDICTED: glutathione S-transferase T3 n=1 Tax=Prunus dulcis TaxID=3755 RepID=A0A5E4G892_PRUDU|nr:hypothetical protein L3X38_004618 [Prunus dulcis]VVA35762.1 PREDICTED: glutathione S-transferase T3 [Prunus dulcis]
MWFGAIGQGKKSFNHQQCWKVVKNCKRFTIIPTGLTIVLNETPLFDSTSSDSPLDSLMSQDLPIQKEPRLIGRKAVKAKRGSTSGNDTAKFLEQIARNVCLRIELDMKKDADEKVTMKNMQEKGSMYANKTLRRRIGKPWAWIQAICPLKQNNFGS